MKTVNGHHNLNSIFLQKTFRLTVNGIGMGEGGGF